jgi:hypothetical protein
MVRTDHGFTVDPRALLQDNSYMRNRNALTESQVANPVTVRKARAKQV